MIIILLRGYQCQEVERIVKAFQIDKVKIIIYKIFNVANYQRIDLN
jgi:hypothetical protein